MIRRLTILVMLIVLTALPALAERPRPLGWAMDAMRNGDWANAARLAARDGPVAADVIEWHRLRAGLGTFDEVTGFLTRRPNWPGETYLRKRSEPSLRSADNEDVIAFFKNVPPQTPRGVLSEAAALIKADKRNQAEVGVISAWRTLAMNDTSHEMFIASYGALLKPHHANRVDAMIWAGKHSDAKRLFNHLSKADLAVAKARIALRERSKGVDALIKAVPKDRANDPGLQYDRFVWRARKGRMEDAKALLLSQSTSAEALDRPEEWANRRRSLARSEMREGNAKRAYQIASRHFLSEGSSYADLEWLSGYIALRKLKDPKTALAHFKNHDDATLSPISKGRAGYWQGRALEAMGDAAGADQAYTRAAQFQTSFYGLLAAGRVGLPFDIYLAEDTPTGDWRTASFAQSALFEAGQLLQASGELDVAERFWTHLAESLDANDAGLLGQAAIDAGQPHLAVMIAKRVARRGIVIPGAYYPLHPLVDQKLPMATEMILSIARRESEFDPSVQSGVGARGLMQIMPGTGRDVAANLGRSAKHTTARLIAEPEYNAELGAAYLATLAGLFDGNVVMMSAGYNAGPGRPNRWMKLFGDPRTNAADMIDWIEHIPFRETRNYVMRVAESLPIYRARLGREALPQSFRRELTGSTLQAFAPKRK